MPRLKDIPGFPGYRVGSDGTVWSRWRRKGLGRGLGSRRVMGEEWRQLKASPDSQGYRVVSLGRGNRMKVGALVLLAFVGPRPSKHEVCHGSNGNGDDSVTNLRWGTSQANTEDQRRAGTLVGGERHGMAKLSNDEVAEIKLMGHGVPQSLIAKGYGISQGHVSEILSGKKRTASSNAGKGLRHG